MPKLIPPSEYAGVCVCHGLEVTGKPSLASPDPAFVYALGGARVLARKIIELDDNSKAHWIPSDPIKRSPAGGKHQ